MASVDETVKASGARSQALRESALVFGVAAVVAVVFAADSSWYAAFMAVHVLAVVVWIGGGTLLTIFGILAERRQDAEEVSAIARMAAFAGERIFAPAGVIVVAMGIAMVIDGHLGFGHFWIIFGLLGFLATFLTGVTVLAPAAKRLSALVETHGATHPETQAAIAHILRIARVDIAMLLVVVVDMVTKPFS